MVSNGICTPVGFMLFIISQRFLLDMPLSGFVKHVSSNNNPSSNFPSHL